MAPAGTQETICRIVEEYSDMLLRLACTRLDSTQDAEDAVQEVFLSLLSSKPVFRDAGHEKAWLIRATLHRASDIRRRAEKRNVPLETTENSPAREEGGELLAITRGIPFRKFQNCWACPPPRWARAWPAAGSGCGRC